MAAPPDGPPASPAERGDPLRARRISAQLLLLAGLGIAIAGLATFHAPTCTGGTSTSPPTCTPWESAQWLMIGGVLLAVPSMLYLARMKMQERLAGEAATTGADRPAG